MNPFLKNIAERLVKKFPENMDHIAIVLPSKRSVIFLKNYLSELIQKPIFLPKFFSIEQFVEYISGYNVLDNISLQFYLYETYLKDKNSDKDSFDKFLGWSNILLNDFNDIDRNLVDSESILSNLKDVKNLDGWGSKNWSLSESDLTNLQQEYIGFYDRLYDWYLDFNNTLSSKNLAYQGMAYRRSAEKINEFQIEWDKIWFVGLNALTAAEEKIIQSLKEMNIARVFWDADEFYYNNSNHEAGEFLRIQKRNWNEINFEGIGNYFQKEKKSFNIISCPKNVAQSRVTSKILSEFKDVDLISSNTAIILADENLLYPVLNYLPDNVKDINVTMGSPLNQTPLFSFFENILNMHLNANNDSFYYKDFLETINHPLFVDLLEIDVIHSIRRKIVDQNKIYISLEYIKDELEKNNTNIDYLFTKWHNSEQAMTAMHNTIFLLRNSLVGQRNSITAEILYTYNKCLKLIDNLLSQHNFIVEFHTFCKILNQLFSREIVPFDGEPLKGIQLMGVLESRTLDFKNVIILSVNEGFLPQGKSINSFIPYDLKLYFKMPTYKDRDSIFAYHFYRLLQRAENINILYNTEMDHLGSGEKSRFITQMLSEYPYEINQYVYSSGDIVFSKDTNLIIENNEVTTQIQKWSKYVSPTALNMYNNCSLSFYYYYLLGIRKKDEVSEYAEADIIGSAIHEAFQDFYPKGIVIDKDIDRIRDRLIETVEEKFQKIGKLENISSGKNYLSLQVAKKLTENFLEYEKSYLSSSAKNGLKLNILESEIELQHVLNIDGVNFTIKGKVDRVDEFDDHIRIFDYKSGSVKASDLSFRDWGDLYEDPFKPKALQLLIYAYLYLKNNPHLLDRKVIVGNFAFKDLKNGLMTLSYYNNKKREVLYIDNKTLEKIEHIIITIVRRIMNSDFTANKDRHMCEYCN